MWGSLLLLLVKDTKFESKSQRRIRSRLKDWNCFYWSKIQNLKANHNPCWLLTWRCLIAFTGQRYKIWKQITTSWFELWHWPVLLLLVKDTKFESKSQHDQAESYYSGNCFYWSKIQNLKANHNCNYIQDAWCKIAFTGQRYKIWKQITTRVWCKRKID